MLILSFGVLTALTELSLRFLMLRSQRLCSSRWLREADKVLNTAIISVSRAHEEIKKKPNKQAKNILDKNSGNLTRQYLTY